MNFALRCGLPALVAGVPPDYFSPTGQLWGNPLYDWNGHRATGYRWWIERIKTLLQLVDVLRLDHFRGFAGYWEIPVNSPTAENGRWAPGPGQDFLDALNAGLARDPEAPALPIIAEDLGVVTPDVARLLSRNGLPGMRVLQFGFAGLDEARSDVPEFMRSEPLPPHDTVFDVDREEMRRIWEIQLPEDVF